MSLRGLLRLNDGSKIEAISVGPLVISGEMVIPKNPTFRDYARYAMYCLEMVPTSPDQDIRDLNREMAVEWIRLAEAALHPVRRTI